MDNLNRLAKAVMQRHHVGYTKALSLLEELRLHLICPPAAAQRAEYQAALLTAINAGKRAFLGGVTAQVPEGIACNLPGWQGRPLSIVIQTLGANLVAERPEANKTVWLGEAVTPREDDLVLLADGWRGGFVPAGFATSFAPSEGFALGGVLAAGITVARCFLDIAGLALGGCDRPFGLSAWSPEQSWLDPRAAGPALVRLPGKVWLLGLGHLGQAYLWTLGLLPYPAQSQALLFLHDYDVITSGNWSAGLLCEPSVVTALKTRTCAVWAEARGFRTRLIERPFDASTRVGDEEPRVALCGFDSASGRRDLEAANFDLVVECGLGSSLDQFDRLLLHTFPDASKHPQDLWPETAGPETSDFDPSLFGVELDEGECGVVLETLARKPISASFVGVTAAALVVAELLRGLHGGQRYELVRLHLRGDDSLGSASISEPYQRRHAANGTLRTAA